MGAVRLCSGVPEAGPWIAAAECGRVAGLAKWAAIYWLWASRDTCSGHEESSEDLFSKSVS